MQRVDSKKTSVPTKDVAVTLGYQMATFSYTGAAVQKAVGSGLGQHQNWLLPVPSYPSML